MMMMMIISFQDTVRTFAYRNGTQISVSMIDGLAKPIEFMYCQV